MNTPPNSKKDIEALRKRSQEQRQKLDGLPIDELLTNEELENAAPFYFILRDFIGQLKSRRQAQGLTLNDVAEKSGLAMESVSRLENGALTNPTWKTLGQYALAVGCRPVLHVDEVKEEGKDVHVAAGVEADA